MDDRTPDTTAALHGLGLAQRLLETTPVRDSAAAVAEAKVSLQGLGLAQQLLETIPVDDRTADASAALSGLRLARQLLETAPVRVGAADSAAAAAALHALGLAQQLLETTPVSDATSAAEGRAAALRALRLAQELLTTLPLHMPGTTGAKASKRFADAFDESEEDALIAYARHVLANDAHVGSELAASPGHNGFYDVTSRSVLLAKLLVSTDAEALDTRALNFPTATAPLGPVARLQNHMLTTNAATSIGCGVRGLTPQQLMDARSNKQLVLNLLWNLTKTKLLAPLEAGRRTELPYLIAADEDEVGFSRLTADQVLLRWLNHHIATFVAANPSQKVVPPSYRVSNLHSDLCDSVALAIATHQIAPAADLDTLRFLRLRDLHQRAVHVLDSAKRIGVTSIQVHACCRRFMHEPDTCACSPGA